MRFSDYRTRRKFASKDDFTLSLICNTAQSWDAECASNFNINKYVSPNILSVKNARHIYVSTPRFSNLAEAQEIYVHIFRNSPASGARPHTGTLNQTAQVNIDEWRSGAPCDSCKYLYMRQEYPAILNRSVSCSLFATNKAQPAKTQTLHRNTGVKIVYVNCQL